MMLTGILFIGICAGSFRLSAFGVDAFTCMNLGISGFLHMTFGTWQLIMNAAVLIVVFFTVRYCIGAGTIVNMAGVVFCLLSGGDLWLIIGIGTICNALFNGPLIQFFKVHVAKPLLGK